MKIALLHMTLGLVDRGSEVYVDLLASELGKNNEVLVFQSGPANKASYHVKRHFPLSRAPRPAPRSIVEKILFRLKLNPGSLFTIPFTLGSLYDLHKFNPDIVIPINGIFQILLLKLFLPKSKIVVLGQAGIGHDDLSSLQVAPHLFVAPSREALNWANNHKNSLTMTAYVANPVNLSLYKQALKIDLGISHPTLLYVGALTAYKNILPLVRAASSIPANLVIIGDGEQGDELADLLSSYPGEFRWIKHIDPGQLPSYYKSADAFAFTPDSQEAFGMVYIEAMAAGLPIVASDDPIRRGIVGSQGHFVRVGDGEGLAKEIIKALKETKLDYGDKLKEYDIKVVSKKLLKLFREL